MCLCFWVCVCVLKPIVFNETKVPKVLEADIDTNIWEFKSGSFKEYTIMNSCELCKTNSVVVKWFLI